MVAYNVSLQVNVTVTVEVDDDDEDFEHNASEKAMDRIDALKADGIQWGEMTCTGVKWAGLPG